MLPSLPQKTVGIYHLPTTGGAVQSYPSTADLTTDGAFIPMDAKTHAIEGGYYTDPHELYVESTVDIRVGDKVVIDSTNFYVKKVFNGWFGPMQHKRASLSSAA